MTTPTTLTYLPPTLTLYLTLCLTLLGSAIGSFLTCLTSRRQSGESILKGRSHCETCHHPLHFPDLIPIISYLTHKGRCRYCHAPIPPTCLIAELAGAILYAATFLHFGLSWNTLMWLIACTLFLSLSLIDAAEQIIPDSILLSLTFNRLLFLTLFHASLRHEIISILTGTLIIPVAMLVLTLIMDKAMGKETMGGGDIKLIFVLGLYMDWKKMFFMIFISCILGLAWIAARKILHRHKETSNSTIAFGPFLCMGCLAAVWFGDPFINWYINLF